MMRCGAARVHPTRISFSLREMAEAIPIFPPMRTWAEPGASYSAARLAKKTISTSVPEQVSAQAGWRRLFPVPRSGRNGNGRDASLLEALAAQYGASLRRLEWDRGFRPAGRAVRPRLRPYGRATRSALGFAHFAALRVVLELLVVKEELFACGEHKIVAAVAAVQNFVDKFHGLLPTDTCQLRACAVLPVWKCRFGWYFDQFAGVGC